MLVDPLEPPMFGHLAFDPGVCVAGVVAAGVDVDAVRLVELFDAAEELLAA
ncbi:MAG: hypothetical protein WCB51_04405 [Candidatus Dormiibacterota bacterium]